MSHDRNAFADERELLSDRDVQSIFDVGANSGETTAYYHALFPKATIHSFEPFPQEFDTLAERFRGDPRVLPSQTAISNQIGRTCFHVNQNSATNSLLPSTTQSGYWTDSPQDLKHVRQLEVPITTIHAYCTQNGISAIDILKIDAQGTERRVLEGAAEELRQGSIALVHTEMQIVPVYEGQVFFYELAAYLSRFGYGLFGIYNMAYAANGQAKWCDAIFLSPDLRARYLRRTKGGRARGARAGDNESSEERQVGLATSRKSESPEQQRDSDALRTDLQECREIVTRLSEETQRLEGVLQEVRHSAGWRLLNGWRKAREQMAPQASLRRRLYDALVGTLRKPKTD